MTDRMRNRWILPGIRIGVAVVVMLVLVRVVDYREIHVAFRNPKHPVFILLALLLLFPNLFLQVYRWYYLLQTVHPRMCVADSVRSFFGGMTLGLITPGRLGEMARSLFLSGEDRWQFVGLVFMDKLYAFVTILLGGLWGMVFLVGGLSGGGRFIVWPLAVGTFFVTTMGLLVLLNPQWIRNFLYHFTLLLPYRDKMRRLIGCMDRFRKDQARFFLVLSFALYGVYLLQFCLLAFAFQRIPWTSALMATVSTILVKTLLPVSLADLGIREGASVYFFSQFQVEKVAAFNSALLLFAINVLLPAVIGLFFLPKLGSKKPPRFHSH